MDSISSEVDVQFNYVLNPINSNEKLTKGRYSKMLVDVEGTFEILVNGQTFFSEEYVLLLELGVALKRWANQIQKNSLKDFEYLTISHTEEPILYFEINSFSQWHMHSPWQKLEWKGNLSTNNLLGIVSSFLNQLNADLKKQYISIDDYL